MPKTPSNKLFRLVKSLSGSEKRYFKIYVKSKGDKNNKYIRLFDAIDAQEEFDEEQLKIAVYADGPIQSRKYSELKSYLYDTILKSLQAYDEKTSVDFRLKGLLQGIKVLYKRLLFDDCKDLLQKAKKLAQKYERFTTLLEVLDWEKQIAYAQTNITFLDKALNRIAHEEQEASTRQQQISELRNIFLRLLVEIRKDASMRKKAQRAKMQQLVESPLLQDIELVRSHHARILYYRIYSLYYYALIDFENFYNTGKNLLELMESKPIFLEEDVSEYISVLSNLVASCSILVRYEEMKEYLERFKTVQTKTIDDELKIHRQFYLGQFEYCIRTGNFVAGLEFLLQHQKEARRFDKKHFESNSFYFNYFYIHFGVNDYSNALEFLNQWLNLPRNIERQELQSMARVLNLIIHYEMGNTLLIESLLRSTIRFLQKRDGLNALEVKIMNFIKNSHKIHSRRELKAVLSNLKEEIQGLPFLPSEKAVLKLFDIEAWLESKIQGKPFAKVIQERYKDSQATAEAVKR